MLFLAATLALTFPDISRLGSHTPGDYGDAYFNHWLLRWDVHALLTSPFGLFDANIFWPARDTLAYSDTLLAVAPLAGVLRVLIGPVLAFNVLYLSTWMLSLGATYVLARRLTGDRSASVLAAFIFTFAAVRYQHYVHLQLLFAGLVPLAVWLLLRFLQERAWWQPAFLGVVFSASILVTAYSALMMGLGLVTMVGAWLVGERARPGPRFGSGLLLVIVVTALLAGPVLWKYRAHRQLLHRDYNESIAAKPGDLLAPVIGSYVHGPLDRLATRHRRDAEHRLFPGLGALVLGAIGALAVRRREGSDRRRAARSDDRSVSQRRELLLVLLASAVLFVLAFGKDQRIAGHQVPLPFAVLTWMGVPGLDSVRALGRFMVFPLLGLALLAARGFVRLTGGRPRLSLAAGVATGAFLLLEYAAPINVVPRVDTPEFTAVNTVLRDLPPGPVVELPMADIGLPVGPYIEPPRMLWSAIDWHPRVNGASAFFPAGHHETVMLLNGLGADPGVREPALRRLDQLGVAYVVVRLAPVSDELNVPGVTHYDEARAGQVLTALGTRAAEVRRAGLAMLIRLQDASP